MLESDKTSRNVQVISQCQSEQVVPELAKAVQQMRAQGLQVDARLLHVRFQNVPTGTTQRGLFSVMCSTASMSPVWQVAVQGSWAPENEFDDWLPLYLRVRTIQVNQQWMGQEMQNRAVVQQQLNRNLQRSIAESNQAFDGYLDSLQNASRSRDYTAHMWSQTTLGQGTWVAENEGAHALSDGFLGYPGPQGQARQLRLQHDQLHGREPLGRRKPRNGRHTCRIRSLYRESMRCSTALEVVDRSESSRNIRGFSRLGQKSPSRV